jgi:predicted nucleic acid-binding protein
VDNAFFNSNVVLYLVSDAPKKVRRAEELVFACGHVSVQVLNETVSVLRNR